VTETRFILVGQGIAGTMLGLELERRGINDFLIIDNDHKASSSMAAAGTINPVTGRNYVKSWMFEDLRNVFIPNYSQLNNLTGENILQLLPVIRSLHSVKEENMWLSRMEDEQYQEYLGFESEIAGISQWIQRPQSYGIIKHAWQLQLRKLLPFFKSCWQNKGQLLTDIFDFEAIQILKNQVIYKDIKADKIIFCEGHGVVNNPFFNHLPFDPVKGEALIIYLKDGFTTSLRDKIFITPLGNDLYWCGANYEWKYTDHKPSGDGYKLLKSQLDEILLQPYEITDHWAGIRPATKSRRPIVAKHEIHNQLFIFNGLGTKGSSLAPYFAGVMADLIQ
jgi:glycine oxidase